MLKNNIVKKLILGLFAIVLFPLVACNSVILEEYKESAKLELDALIEMKVESNYTEDEWSKILDFVETGKASINEATDKPQVDAAKGAATQAINEVPLKEVALMQIQARQTYLEEILKGKNQAATIDDVSFFRDKFLGVYDGSLVGVFYGGQYHGNFPEVEESVEIEGLPFAWSRGYPILVWNDGEIYGFAEAFGQNLLTVANIVTIHGLYYSEI